MNSYCLPRVTAHADVPVEAVAMVHRALRRIPPALADMLWPVYVFVRADFPWNHANDTYEMVWKDTGGYWDQGYRCAVVNAAWCQTQSDMDAVVLHEMGHALSLAILPQPHRTPEFRAAWREGAARVRAEFPEHYRKKRGLGIYCIHWTRAIQEVWAEAVAWLLDARGTTHPAFGQVFAGCIAIVADSLGLKEREAA